MHARARARFRPGIALCVLLALCLRVRAQENGGGSSLTGLAEATRVLRETDAAPHDPRGVLAALLGVHANLGTGAEDAMHAWMTDVFQSKWEHRPCTDDHDHTGALPSNDPLFNSGMVPPAGLQLANMLELLGSNRNAATNLDHLIMVKSRDGKSVEQVFATPPQTRATPATLRAFPMHACTPLAIGTARVPSKCVPWRMRARCCVRP